MMNPTFPESSVAARTAAPLLVVVFGVAGQRYGLPVGNVCEVVRIPALLGLAGAPPGVCGLLNLRGRHVPVLDVRALIGEPPAHTLASQIVIVDERGRANSGTARLGLLVDEVRGVQSFAASQVLPLGVESAAGFLRGILNDGPESLLLLDAAGLIELVPAGAERS